MSQADIEASRSEPGTSRFDIEASQPVGPMSQWAGAAQSQHRDLLNRHGFFRFQDAQARAGPAIGDGKVEEAWQRPQSSFFGLGPALFWQSAAAAGRTGPPSPGGDKALSMPTHDSLGPHDGYGIKDARAAAIKPNEQSAVDPTQMQSTARRTLPKNVELMPQYQDFGL
jgi:hypothetical protein